MKPNKKRKPRDVPASIRIAGVEFDVVLDNSSAGLDRTNIGEFSQSKGLITLDSNITSQRRRKVLLHELVHGADIMFGAGDMAEQQVVAVENGLWAIFNDNPGLAKIIFGEAA